MTADERPALGAPAGRPAHPAATSAIFPCAGASAPRAHPENWHQAPNRPSHRRVRIRPHPTASDRGHPPMSSCPPPPPPNRIAPPAPRLPMIVPPAVEWPFRSTSAPSDAESGRKWPPRAPIIPARRPRTPNPSGRERTRRHARPRIAAILATPPGWPCHPAGETRPFMAPGCAPAIHGRDGGGHSWPGSPPAPGVQWTTGTGRARPIRARGAGT